MFYAKGNEMKYESTNQNITPLFQEGNEMNARELITEANPLFETIHIDGRTYITSKKLHQDYRNNDGEKYSESRNFLRMIRQIPLYKDLVAAGSMLEICQKKALSKAESAIKVNNREVDLQICSNLERIIKANYGNPFMLIDPVAQKCIENHLDNEESKESALRTNALGAAVETGDEHAKQIVAKGYGNVPLNQNLGQIAKFFEAQTERLDYVLTEAKQVREENLKLNTRLNDCYLTNTQVNLLNAKIRKVAKRESQVEGGINYGPATGYVKKLIKANYIEEKNRGSKKYSEIPQRRFSALMDFLDKADLEIYRESWHEDQEKKRLEKMMIENENNKL